MHPTKAPVKYVLLWMSCIMLLAGALLTVTYWFTAFDLTGALAQSAYWVSESGGTIGIPVIGIAMIGVVVSRTGLSRKQRVAEALAIVLGLATFLGGGAFLNEHFVKPLFAVPRPDIIELAETPLDAPVLKMSAQEFYAKPTKALRSEHLKVVLTPEVMPAMHEQIRGHWITETGYSFPSGHSFSSMMFATFFLAMGRSYFSDRRLWIFYSLVLWAVAVCVSRPILRVHSPTDICVGCIEGIVAGSLAFLLVRGLLAVFTPLPGRPRREGPQSD